MAQDIDFGFGFGDLPKYLQRLKNISIVKIETVWGITTNTNLLTLEPVKLGESEHLFFERIVEELDAAGYIIPRRAIKRTIQDQFLGKATWYQISNEEQQTEPGEYEFFFDIAPVHYRTIALLCSFK